MQVESSTAQEHIFSIFLKIIRNTKTDLTFADKTTNLYTVPKEQYKKLVNSAITTSYKKINKKTQAQINR